MMESWGVEFAKKPIRMALVLVKKKMCFSQKNGLPLECTFRRSRDSKLSMLRGKIRKHVNSRAHEIANEIIESQKTDSISGAVRKLENEEIRKTEIVFRTVYTFSTFCCHKLQNCWHTSRASEQIVVPSSSVI